MTAAVELKVPRLAESISEAVLAEWLKPDGATVKTDEPVVTLETDKAAVEIAATETGVLRHTKAPGERVVVGDVIARIEITEAKSAASTEPPQPVAKPAGDVKTATKPGGNAAPAPSPKSTEKPGVTPATPAPVASAPAPAVASSDAPPFGPAARRLLEEHGLAPADVAGTGRGGRILKEDVQRHVERPEGAQEPTATAPAPLAPPASASAPAPAAAAAPSAADERVVPMSRIRQRIAERLVQAQHAAAILTTFNEVDMTAVLDVRARYKESFEKRHGVKLGFMSFFARACINALREIPELNAEIRGTDIVYRDAVHLGVAVGTERGLIVPVVRDAHTRDFAGVEREIARLAERARDQTLSLDEMVGGTFTISNGGVYGSLLSTPILNPPQSGILGMHKIEKRPVVVDDQIVIRPMMYVALSYDHRIVDGEQAVTFLVRAKESLESPERMLLDV